MSDESVGAAAKHVPWRMLKEHREAVIEECARVVDKLSEEALEKDPCCYLDAAAAAIRALKDRP